MSDIEQLRKNIKEELAEKKPSAKTILSYLMSLRFDKNGIELETENTFAGEWRYTGEWRYVSEVDFFDIFEETFSANPEFYMKKLYYAAKIKNFYFRNLRKKGVIPWKSFDFLSLRDLGKAHKGIDYLGKLSEMDFIIHKNDKNF